MAGPAGILEDGNRKYDECLAPGVAGGRGMPGIVEDEKMFGLGTDAPPALYANLYQAPPRASTSTLMVRTSGDPRQLKSA